MSLSFLSALLAIIACALLIPPLARAGLASCLDGQKPQDLPYMRHIATFGGIAIALTSILSGQGPAFAFVSTLFGGFLAAASYLDRETSWAPDHLLFPISVLGFSVAGFLGMWGLTPFIGFLVGAFGYLALMGVWLLVNEKTDVASLLPPNDILSILVPLAFLGPGLSVFFMIAAAILLMMVRFIPGVRKLFLREDVAIQALAEMEVCDGRAEDFITLLMVTLPAAFVFLIVAMTQEIF